MFLIRVHKTQHYEKPLELLSSSVGNLSGDPEKHNITSEVPSSDNDRFAVSISANEP